jgi:L-threonylcarbamoyladenylate synthase
METIKIDLKDSLELDKKSEYLDHAAGILARGGIVAFPTETVYGLGADALNPAAVAKIFTAKGRPQDNPLIIHVADRDLSRYVRNIPKKAEAVMERFWPGPLTIILEKTDLIPVETSAGLPTVGVRMPSDPVALELIRRLGRPIAAPSANISGRPSPTTYRRCVEDLDGRVDMIIGGGRSIVGLESTIVDYSVFPPRVLRPGFVTIEMLKEVDSDIQYEASFTQADEDEGPKAPGMKYRHYSPKAPILIVKGDKNKVVEKITSLVQNYIGEGRRVGIIGPAERKDVYPPFPEGMSFFIPLGDEEGDRGKARDLFEVLRQFDDLEVDIILSEAVQEQGIGTAVMNRLSKASGFNIIEV